ncbi:FUSC family protein [Streptomyces spinosisporus]|uniref:Aromatic acid exporter family protein n=1 Tax=Streptomyces spinosisporus TaxID=2927582 RepID=A0ABS9XMP1_9ACTN|nr:aromatic acid exporter family protein [Streptomyces spinosisporus]MCI3243286.1 aromatic acid exporter family protein [Streptomyces spinosisporus]
MARASDTARAVTTTLHGAAQAVPTKLHGAAQAVRRAWEQPGRERDLAAQALKAAFAAWLSWAVVGWWLHAPMAFVAPWVAILLVESTVYQSVAHALQQLAAIAAGTVMATVLVLLMHNRIGAMGLVLPVVVLLSSWWRLGRQGIYTATGALFVLTDTHFGWAASAARIGEAAFGATVGIAVNALIRPPVYLRNARASLQEAARKTAELLEKPAGRLVDGQWDEDEAKAWHQQALHIQRLVEECRSAVGWSRESLWGNVRRRNLAPSSPAGDDEDALVVLEYAAVHTTELTRTLVEAAAEDRQSHWAGLPLIHGYADFLAQAAQVMRLSGQSGEGRDHDESLRQAAREMRSTVDGLHRQMLDSVPGEPEEASAYGALILQAQRLAWHLDASAREDSAHGPA